MSPKTKIMRFTLKGEINFFEPVKYHKLVCNGVNCNCPTIEVVNEIKYLGLTLDSDVT